MKSFPKTTLLFTFSLFMGSTLFGCGDQKTSVALLDAGQDGSPDTDVDTDSDTDSDADGDSDTGSAERCNGHHLLCSKPFNQVIYPATHFAMAYQTPPFAVMSQEASILEQLQGGIRALWLEVHLSDGELVLCRKDCAAGKLPLAKALNDTAAFLESFPREVVSILLRGDVAHESLASAIEPSEIAPWLGTLPAAGPLAGQLKTGRWACPDAGPCRYFCPMWPLHLRRQGCHP